jgi:hypothetical protein
MFFQENGMKLFFTKNQSNNLSPIRDIHPGWGFFYAQKPGGGK